MAGIRASCQRIGRIVAVTRIGILIMLLSEVAQALSPAVRSGAQPALPPGSYTCPMHPEVIEDKAGICRICKMDLVPVRLDTAYSCPVHTSVIGTAPGRCPVCRRSLAPVTISLFWTCAGHPDVHEVQPGRCADGQPRIIARERRAHGDHNPRHGGQFFMASDNWHHLEAVYPRAGVFRVFVYDDFTKPIRLNGITGRAVTREAYDPAMKTYKDVTTFPLTPSKTGRYLEARVPLGLPVQITTKVKFLADGPEHRFDFSFAAYTKEPPPGTVPPVMTTAPSPTQVEAAPGEDAPQTTDGLLAALKANANQVDALLEQGALAQLYIPALATKDTALTLESRTNELPDNRRGPAAAAVRRIVLAAWLIDLYGDLGDKPKLTDAYQSFAAGVADLVRAYEKAR
jgi:hypothetical protein